MASGKTTVGRTLAELLDRPFIDLDAEVERATGMTIPQIFERRGEAFFRQAEGEALARLARRPASVVAIGGGTMVAETNLRLLRESGVMVWLDPPFEVMVSRLALEETEVRPLYREEDQARTLYQERLPAYRRADLRIGIGSDEAPAEVARRVAQILRETACGI
ncbi:MAG: shikimate kinase [Thermoanaerobaculia bacterium]